MNKDNQIVVLTGAAQGLGRATAEYFWEKGATLALLDYNHEALNKWAGNLDRIVTYQADITKQDRLEEIADDIMSRFGRIDALINCAGRIAPQRPLEEWTEQMWRSVMDTNTTGTFLCTLVFGKKMLDVGGAIVNFSSVTAFIPSPGRIAYPASKAAIWSMTQQTAQQWGARGIRCNCVCPGTIKTEMTAHFFDDEESVKSKTRLFASGRMGEPSDVAKAVYYLASPDLTYINGEFIRVDGGFTLCPLTAYNIL